MFVTKHFYLIHMSKLQMYFIYIRQKSRPKNQNCIQTNSPIDVVVIVESNSIPERMHSVLLIQNGTHDGIILTSSAPYQTVANASTN